MLPVAVTALTLDERKECSATAIKALTAPSSVSMIQIAREVQ